MTHETRRLLYSAGPGKGEVQALAALQASTHEIASLESDLDNIRVVLQRQANRIEELENTNADLRARLGDLNSPQIERDLGVTQETHTHRFTEHRGAHRIDQQS